MDSTCIPAEVDGTTAEAQENGQAWMGEVQKDTLNKPMTSLWWIIGWLISKHLIPFII